MIVAGVDIGSLNSRIAILGTDGAPILCPDLEQTGIVATPSTVHIGNNHALVGLNAEEALEESPRLPAMRNPRAALGLDAASLTDASGQAWHGDALLAVLLRKLNRDVRAFANGPIAVASLSLPSWAGEQDRQGMSDAALLAGLSHATVVEAPLAAATYHRSLGHSEACLLVVDVGAGGHDCAIVVPKGEGLAIERKAGSGKDGSEGIDQSIIRIVADQYRDEHGLDVLRDPANELPLRRFAEHVKLSLLLHPNVDAIRQTVLIGRKIVRVVITRRQVSLVAEKLLARIEASARECLAGAAAPVERVLLIGGARQLPGLRSLLESLVPGVPFHEREHAAVLGAALLAGSARPSAGTGPARGQLGYDIGMRVWNAAKSAPDIRVLIAAGSALPATETLSLYTRRANQDRLVLDLVRRTGNDTEGESLSTFEFGPFAGMPKDHPVEILVACDGDGIIKVTARDPQTRREISQYSSERENAGAERLARLRDQIASLSVNE